MGTPIESARDLRYRAWIEGNRAHVARAGAEAGRAAAGSAHAGSGADSMALTAMP